MSSGAGSIIIVMKTLTEIIMPNVKEMARYTKGSFYIKTMTIGYTNAFSFTSFNAESMKVPDESAICALTMLST